MCGLTHCRLDPLVFDRSFALAWAQATLQPLDLLGDPVSLRAHQVHHRGRAGCLLLLPPLLRFASIWQEAQNKAILRDDDCCHIRAK